MSIQNKTKRIERLEAKEGPKQMLDAIVLQGVRPSPDGPMLGAAGSAFMMKGKLTGSTLVKKPDESWNEFKVRVKEAHSE